jgi:hypothetical protein
VLRGNPAPVLNPSCICTLHPSVLFSTCAPLVFFIRRIKSGKCMLSTAVRLQRFVPGATVRVPATVTSSLVWLPFSTAIAAAY